MLCLNHAVVTPGRANPQAGASAVVVPGPGVAEPERGQEMECGGVGPTICGGDTDQDVVSRSLGVFHDNVEIAVLVKTPVSISSYSKAWRLRCRFSSTS